MKRQSKHSVVMIAVGSVLLIVFCLLVPFSLHSINRFSEDYANGLHQEIASQFSGASSADRQDTDTVTSFIVGRSFYNLNKFNEAAPWLLHAAEKDTPLRDHALYYAGQSLEKSGDKKLALEQYFRITSQYPASIYASPAANRAFSLGVSEENYALLEQLGRKCAESASTSAQKAQNLAAYAKAMQALEKPDDAIDAYFAILALDLYNENNTKAVQEIINATESGEKQFPTDKIMLLIKGMIRAQMETRAEILLRLLPPTLSNDLQEEATIIKGWLARRKQDWNTAIQQFSSLLDSRENKFRAYANLFYVYTAQRDYDQALSTAKKATEINIEKASDLFSHLVSETSLKNESDWKYALEAAKIYPGMTAMQRELMLIIAHDWNRENFQTVASRCLEMLDIELQPDYRAGANYFAGAALSELGRQDEAASYFKEAIVNEPLGYYHYRCLQEKRVIPGDTLSIDIEKSGMPILAKNYFLANRELRAQILEIIERQWNRNSLRRVSLDSVNLSSASRHLKNTTRRSKYRYFIREELFQEAFSEAIAGLSKEQQQTADVRLMLAALNNRTHHNNRTMYWTTMFLKNHGLGREMAVVEKNFPGTLFSYAYPLKFTDLIEKYAGERSLSPLLVLALIRQESGFSPKIGSWAGAKGLMQVMPTTGQPIADRLNISNMDLLDPEHNIPIGTAFLGWLFTLYDDIPTVLIGYNAGPGRVRQWKRDFERTYGKYNEAGFIEYAPILETRNYIKVVLANYMVYRFLYEK